MKDSYGREVCDDCKAPHFMEVGEWPRHVCTPMFERLEKERDAALKSRDEFQEAEKKLSDAYLRIRKLVDAWKTPYAPTAEQVYEHTENFIKQLIKSRDEWEEKAKILNNAYINLMKQNIAEINFNAEAARILEKRKGESHVDKA